MLPKVKLDQLGFGMFEGLVALVLIVTSILSFISFSKYVGVSNERVRTAAEIISAQDLVHRLLNDSDTCFASLQTATFDSTDAAVKVPLNQIRYSPLSATPFLRVGEKIPALPHVDVDLIEISRMRQVQPDTFLFDLRVDLSRPGIPVPSLFVRNFLVYTDPASPANAKKPLACGMRVAQNCRYIEVTAPDSNAADVLCGPGEKLESSGASCLMEDASGTLVAADMYAWITTQIPIEIGGRSGTRIDCGTGPAMGGPTEAQIRARVGAVCCPQ